MKCISAVNRHDRHPRRLEDQQNLVNMALETYHDSLAARCGSFCSFMLIIRIIASNLNQIHPTCCIQTIHQSSCTCDLTRLSVYWKSWMVPQKQKPQAAWWQITPWVPRQQELSVGSMLWTLKHQWMYVQDSKFTRMYGHISYIYNVILHLYII